MRLAFLILTIVTASAVLTSCGIAQYQMSRAANLLRVPVRTGQVTPSSTQSISALWVAV